MKQMNNPDTVLIYSGGMDSTTLLYKLRDDGCEPLCLSFDYGQRHSRELTIAQDIASQLSLEHLTIHLPKGFFAGSSQTSPNIDVPYGHYAAENMKLTVVPNRNMVMLALATSLAISRRITRIAYAAHAGDHTIYPDCRPEFVETFDRLLFHCDWNPPHLVAPFLHLTKADICLIGASLKVPFELTYSCYEGGETHCGKCGTCVERREAFELAGVPDPTSYLRHTYE